MTQSGPSFPSIPHQLSCLTGKSTLRLCAEPPTYQKTDTAGKAPVVSVLCVKSFLRTCLISPRARLGG